MTDWKPIETAPRDGSFILAFNEAHHDYVVVAWQPGDDDEADHWDDVGDRNAQPSIYFNQNYFQFWQPLPVPPSECAVRGGK